MLRYDFSRLTALVVDDNGHMRELIREILEACQFGRVLEATNGAEALQVLSETRVDLVFTDWMMSPMDGHEFVSLVRKDPASPNPMLPIIMLTGHSDRYRVQAARDVGATEFLAKPISANALLSRIVAVIERPRVFVRSTDYVGPDRRRRREEGFSGEDRRTVPASVPEPVDRFRPAISR